MSPIVLAAGIRATFFVAFFLSPLLATILLIRRPDPVVCWARTAVFAVLLNTCLPLLLVTSGIPLTQASLAKAHWFAAAILVLYLFLSRAASRPREALSRAPEASFRWLLLLVAAHAALVLPVTGLAGIDTYRWQDIATAIRVEQGLPWLVHPVCIFGFGGRATPHLQPLLLATAQMLGGLDVEGGFYTVSVLCSVVAVPGIYRLGRRFSGNPLTALFSTYLYVLSPVFMRYSHWATGRGFFLALYPYFLLCLLDARKPRNLLGLTGFALLLTLSHKTGLALIVLSPFLWLASFAIPRHISISRRVVIVLLVSFAASATAASLGLPRPLGHPVGAAWTALSRFGCLLPLIGVVVFTSSAWPGKGPRRIFVPFLLLTLGISCMPDMYGAMLALPFAALYAADGLVLLKPQRLPRLAQVALVLAALLPAVAIVVERGRNATPSEVRAAAHFLERLDPQGPFRLSAPAGIGSRMQGYLSGCPRFHIEATGPVRLEWRGLPGLGMDLQTTGHDWIDALRTPFTLGNTEISWYGSVRRVYHVRVGDKGHLPADGQLVYNRDNVQIVLEELEP